MDDSSPHHHPAVGLAKQLVQAIRDGEIDQAEAVLEDLRPLVANPDDLLVFPVLIAIQRGQVVQAFQYLSTLGEDKGLELKALCLSMMGDPAWQGVAQQALESPDVYVRRAMQQLSGQPVEPLPDEAAATPVGPPEAIPYASIRLR